MNGLSAACTNFFTKSMMAAATQQQQPILDPDFQACQQEISDETQASTTLQNAQSYQGTYQHDIATLSAEALNLMGGPHQNPGSAPPAGGAGGMEVTGSGGPEN